MRLGTYGEPDAVSKAIDYAKFYSRSHDAVIRVHPGSPGPGIGAGPHDQTVSIDLGKQWLYIPVCEVRRAQFRCRSLARRWFNWNDHDS